MWSGTRGVHRPRGRDPPPPRQAERGPEPRNRARRRRRRLPSRSAALDARFLSPRLRSSAPPPQHSEHLSPRRFQETSRDWKQSSDSVTALCRPRSRTRELTPLSASSSYFDRAEEELKFSESLAGACFSWGRPIAKAHAWRGGGGGSSAGVQDAVEHAENRSRRRLSGAPGDLRHASPAGPLPRNAPSLTSPAV
ncbi:hypothetical protein SKAU_G00123870 [Synaphobranchus kaupii]|uniref:Uncharacterized protein n=1 Tax=Synaphobranchus kaupii TaxID=118154 RepID=A0A9Q1FPL6_SYNKA|nr:hypothetical protein SKAU_G00123870 [Synaphobranchus kaupii]